MINAANVCKCTRGSASLILTVGRARATELDPRCKSRGGGAARDSRDLDDSLCSGVVVAVPAAPAVSALVGRAPEASPWFVRRRGVIIDVPEGAVAGSRAIVSLPDDGSARQATVTIAFPPGLSTGQELTVALEV